MTKTVKVSLSFDEIFEMKRYITCGAAFADRISFNLVVQLLCLQEINREDFDILTEIRNLEGGPPSSTKPATQFKHPPLYPLWHKHFSTARHTFRNIAERWNLSRGSGNKDLQNMLSDVTRVEAKDPRRLPGSIAHKLILEGLMDRSAARRMTGDWIIFAKSGGQNYYLGVSAHEDGQVGTPAIELYESLKNACSFEFPFLFTED